MSAAPTVLYIDDDPGIGRLVQRALERNGFMVTLALSAEEGLSKLSQASFDLVALDHHMPGQTGLQALARIQALAAPPPVVYVTGSEDSHVAVSALKAGAVDYVWKDVQGHFRELLAEALKTAMEKERLRRAKEAAESEVRAGRDRAELLLKEVNHRVANSLTIVASLVNLQRTRVDDPDVKAMLEDMRGRILAVAAVHRRLYTSQDVGSVDLEDYLRHLVDDLQRSKSGEGSNHVVTLQCPSISLPTDKAVSFGIIVTELLTNAYKYAYPDRDAGEIRVRVETKGEDGLLVVEDDGVGLRGVERMGTGLGSRIVTMMAASLGGAIETTDAAPGVRATMHFKI